MMSVSGKSYDFQQDCELENLVREGFELHGKLTWSDHFPFLGCFDLQLQGVNVFVGKEHIIKRDSAIVADQSCVDTLLDLEEENSLSDFDIIAVLREHTFRGTYAGAGSVPAVTTAMVNNWAATHSGEVWSESERFTEEVEFNILGSDMRFAGFGGGRSGKARVQVCSYRISHAFLQILPLTCLTLWNSNTNTPCLLCKPLFRAC